MRFLLVDKIYELEPGKRIKASKRLPAEEELFLDHFPGFPVVPGVLLTEMMAQAAGKCLDAGGNHQGRAILAKICSASFRSWVGPNEEVVIYAEISQNQPGYATANCFVEVSGKRVCTAELFFAFSPDARLAPPSRDDVLDAYRKAFTPQRQMCRRMTGVNLFSLKDKNALITGGTRGIGRSISLQFARSGAKVVANYVRADATASSLLALAEAEDLCITTCRGDLTLPNGLAAVDGAVTGMPGKLDILVHCAATGVHRPFEELTLRHLDWTLALNVRAFFELTRRLLPRFADGSSILAVSSQGGLRAIPAYSAVGTSKGALEALARHLAVELAPKGIRVNILAPGAVATEAWDVMPNGKERLADLARRTPTGRLTTPEEVAYAAQFLCSQAASSIIGQTLVIDGGGSIPI